MLAHWMNEQYRENLTAWERHVKSVRWQSFLMVLPCFGLFLLNRSWPFAFLFMLANFWGWRRIRRAQSLQPNPPPPI